MVDIIGIEPKKFLRYIRSKSCERSSPNIVFYQWQAISKWPALVDAFAPHFSDTFIRNMLRTQEGQNDEKPIEIVDESSL